MRTFENPILVPLGNNQPLACDPISGEVRRFLTGPVNCETAGDTWTSDGRTMFVSIQHHGEGAGGRNDPANPRRWSNWPNGSPIGRPRAAAQVVRKDDGGVTGS
jgi:secreted PhoX family phosphatase